MSVETVPFTVARGQLAELMGRVAYGGERIVLSRHGKPAVALVSIADLERLQAMAEREETSQVMTLGKTSFDLAEPSRQGEPRRFDIAAEQVPPGDLAP
ncbi:type II toxin-antitoxin system Phd/YefM family antitoxin [Streptosporangium lutulentum]|uniref:Antitoxin n=1 Tax=Streptosporangium lutulentum TaxID=1461250 RepID=A0ABT9QP96_9ACTN|nr:type II toxin-antitoxin system Phd/YefM family antitoxin [Streptosporangium lutulentum]MDP9847834.1 prevent-host-death family protein [Streptosporangium lutulentum]